MTPKGHGIGRKENNMRIRIDLKSSKGMIIWLVVMGVGFMLVGILENKDLSRLPGLWLIMFCWILALEILNRYFSYLLIYPDYSFRVVDWFLHRLRIHPKDVQAVGVARKLDKTVKELYVVYKDQKGIKQEFVFSIAGYASYYIAQLLNNILTTNQQVELDAYCQELVDKYRIEPEKLEKNWQDKFKFKWPLPQWATDILMFLLLLLSVYLFFHVATSDGWCWDRRNPNTCYSGPMI